VIRTTRLQALQGRRVTVALRNGTRIDDAHLVSAGSYDSRRLWLFQNGSDTFVPLDEVLELWDDRFQTLS